MFNKVKIKSIGEGILVLIAGIFMIGFFVGIGSVIHAIATKEIPTVNIAPYQITTTTNERSRTYYTADYEIEQGNLILSEYYYCSATECYYQTNERVYSAGTFIIKKR